MEARLQRRIQRYGWDRAVTAYEPGWHAQLAPAHARLLDMVALARGERVLDAACGTGLVSLKAAEAVGPRGSVVGTDISGEMVESAREAATRCGIANTRFERADAEDLPFADRSFDAAVCALGLMYVADPMRALGELRRLVCPGGRVAAVVWGARRACGWAEIFPITDARIASEVCPMFFRLGTKDMLARSFETAGLIDVRLARVPTVLRYPDAAAALAAVFQGGPVALAYSRFDPATKEAVHAEYLESIAAHGGADGYRIPGEFVVAAGRVPTH